MGFEELASLRDELAQKAAAEKSIKRQKAEGSQSVAKKSPKVDPVVLIIGQLQKKFPLAFPKNPAPKVPLKIGIHKDLIEQTDQLGISKNDLRAAIKIWCKGKRYWDCLVEGAVRIDLEGNAAGVVTKEETKQGKSSKKLLSSESTSEQQEV